MQSNRNCDAKAFIHGFDHRGDRFESGHVFPSTAADAENHWRIELLGSEKHSLRPFEIVDVELTDGIMPIASQFKHSCCID